MTRTVERPENVDEGATIGYPPEDADPEIGDDATIRSGTIIYAEVEIGDSVHISAVTLPPNVTPTITDRDFTICAVVGRGPAAEEAGEEGEGPETEA